MLRTTWRSAFCQAVVRSQARSKSHRLPRPMAPSPGPARPARKKTSRLSSSSLGPASFMTWNGSGRWARAPSQPLLVDTHQAQRDDRSSPFPALQRVLLRAPNRRPRHPILRGHVHHGHRGCLQGEMLLQASRLPLVRCRPRDGFDGRRHAVPAADPHRRVLHFHRVTRPGPVAPAAGAELLVILATWTQALAKPREPPALEPQDHPRRADRPQRSERLHPRALRRLEEQLLYLPAVESKDVGQSATALPRLPSVVPVAFRRVGAHMDGHDVTRCRGLGAASRTSLRAPRAGRSPMHGSTLVKPSPRSRHRSKLPQIGRRAASSACPLHRPHWVSRRQSAQAEPRLGSQPHLPGRSARGGPCRRPRERSVA